MTPERWQQVKEIFHSALQHEPDKRSVFLSNACGGDESLRQEVEWLITSYEKDGSFIDSPAFEYAADLLSDTQSTMASGQTLGSYRILSTLGRGGMGEVYLAEDTRLGRKVALKFLPSSVAQDQDRLRRFEREARGASALNHPNILTIYEIGSADSRQFIATEYIDGETLRQRMVHSRLSVTKALEIAIQAASALSAAHQAGIVHRDIKPENIMLRRDGYVKVVDFGLAKLTEAANLALDTSQPTALQIDTATGTVMGTTAYMSPEQSRAFVVDARSDIWSLGVVLYEMISGHAPFRGQTTSDLIVSILEREPISLTNLSTDVPEELAWIVTKTLTKNRDDRYQTAREMLNDLRRLKQRLDLATEMERSVTPSFRQETPGEPTKSAVVTTIQTDPLQPGHTTQVAVLPIEWVKRKRILAALCVVIAAGMLFGIYKLLITKSPQPDTVATSQVVETKQITFSKALDNFPSLSPDGNSIAYSSDQGGNFEIYVKQLAPGGREFSLTSDGRQNVQPAWSPDGQRIAYISLKSSGIWIVPALGGVPKQLTDFGSNPAWSRDGAFVAFQSIPPGEVGQSARGPMPPSTLWIVASQGGTPKQITQVGRPAGGHGLPSWSPDGKRLAFVNSDYLSSTIWSIAIRFRR
jgi:predicted Ser/Thr protein kinase